MTRPIYRRHEGVLVLRAATAPAKARPSSWPAFDSADACRQWLARIWADGTLVVPLRAASPRLADQVERILNGDDVPPKKICKATCSVAGYVLRATGRPTPFGLFAGVALAGVGPTSATIGPDHRPVARPDTLWVDQVRRGLQRRADVLPHLTLGISSLAFRRGGTVNTPRSGGRIAGAGITRPVSVLLRAATTPASGRELLRRLTEAGGTPEQARRLTVQALTDGYLTSSLAAPMTVDDPMGHILRVLTPHLAELEPETQNVLAHLREVRRLLAAHNRASGPDAHKLRETADDRMRFAAAESRSRVGLDLGLDARVRVPAHVLDEAEKAAHALLRLTRTRGPAPVWAAYATQFWERYGAGVLVPVRDAVDLAAGIGFPADYPLSQWSRTPTAVLPRDEKLAAKAAQAVMDGTHEVVLTEADIEDLEDLEDLAADAGTTGPVAPHVEMGLRVRAASQEAVDRGDFLLDVRPAWTAGVLSGRFTAVLGPRLSDPYRTLPTMTQGALPAQLSFAPDFPHAENVARVPALLPHILSVGEHREPADNVIGLDDLAVVSTGRRLHLVSVSRRRVVEPVVLHPLALEKQAPPMARFLAMLGRGFATAWTAFDWGPAAAALPFLPRVRHRRTILSPARWTLPAASLPSGPFTSAWHDALTGWTSAWRCPPRLELHDGDRSMSLDLAEPLHARLIHRYLQAHEHAVLTETVDDGDLGWIGHAHEITMPLAVTGPQVPHPDLAGAPLLKNTRLHHPGDTSTRWLQAKVFTHPTAMDEILTGRLPALLEDLGTADVWFARYRSLHETGHLRIRVPADGGAGHAGTLQAVAAWTGRLTADRLASHLVIDGYRPETGRYGTGPAMAAAEAVFVADSLVARYALTDVPSLATEVRCALGMIDMAEGFLGTREGRTWMAVAPAPRPEGHPEVTTRPAVRHVRSHPLLTASPRLAAALAQRRAALGAYRAHVDGRRTEQVLESLLHMHHNRMTGPDRVSEAACRHAARQACRSLTPQGEA
ncbi:lantibiotic dehydratase [Streptomyces sp. NPDC097107]|uniref:lantibiotic dehydratase n=1 Tax=Streptomyces sp. NPDC097107 TaxID=3366089 RepID=UPI0037F8833C